MRFVDTETVGFTGMPVLIQSGDLEHVNIHKVWEHTAKETLDHIESLIAEDCLVLYNASYDSFHLHKLFNALLGVKDINAIPDPNEIKAIELQLPHQPKVCLKPANVIDIYVLLKTGRYNWVNHHKPIFITKVPEVIAGQLKEILDTETAKLPKILFTKTRHRSYWSIEKKEPNLVNFKLEFSPSLALKAITKYAFDIETKEIKMPPHFYPAETEFNPFVTDWPQKLWHHKEYWNTEYGQKYATEDILHLRRWWEEMELSAGQVDINSNLAWMVGAVRFGGFEIDPRLLEQYLAQQVGNVPTAPAAVKKYLDEVLTPLERAALKNTSRKTLDFIVRAKDGEEASIRAQKVLDARKLEKELDLFQKLLSAGRYYPDFNVCGTVSNRMSGRGGINPQGIQKSPAIRKIFTLTDKENHLSGGDFEGQEVTIAAAAWGDTKLIEELQAGQKIHQIVASMLYECSYDEVTPEQYYKAKQGVFSLIYGAQIDTFARTCGVTLEHAQKVYDEIKKRYPKVPESRDRIFNMFCSMRQPNGIGTRVEWHEPQDEMVSFLGFARNFKIENRLSKILFHLSDNCPIKHSGRIVRKEREQTVVGALRSALYAAAFRLQAKNMSQACNHDIQASGAIITKTLQYNIWNLQPVGINPFRVKPLNVHDELLVVNDCPDEVKIVVDCTVAELKSKVPLLKIDWKHSVNNWAEIKGKS